MRSLDFFLVQRARLLIFFRPKKDGEYEWMNECEEAFMRLNMFMATPPILTHPTKGTPLFIYLSVTNKVMRFVFIQEKDKILSNQFILSTRCSRAHS